MQSLMMEYGSVFRNEEGLKRGIEEIRSLKRAIIRRSRSVNKGKDFQLSN